MAFDEMFVGGILWFISRGVEKYACGGDTDWGVCLAMSQD